MNRVNNDQINRAYQMLGIRQVVPQQIAVAPVVQPKNIKLPIIEDDDEISVQSIIQEKPPIKDVRDFFKDNLDELELMEN
jgi:hypothetical protein